MKICLNQISKRYRNNWIFKNVNYTFANENIYAILGVNGSGKSTLMRIIGGIQEANAGTVEFWDGIKKIPLEKAFRYISYCAPGIDLVEEMTLQEFLDFHFSFKKMLPGFTLTSVIEKINLSSAREKHLSEFSSGMKQRVKLAQAFFADTKVLLLDEPCSNLDASGIALYQELLQQLTDNRITIIASNDEREYDKVHHFIRMETFSISN